MAFHGGGGRIGGGFHGFGGARGIGGAFRPNVAKYGRFAQQIAQQQAQIANLRNQMAGQGWNSGNPMLRGLLQQAMMALNTLMQQAGQRRRMAAGPQPQQPPMDIG
jgi:hypothetical protein